MAKTQHGGSFAPPLTDELLAKYKAMFTACDPKTQVGDVCQKLMTCCEKWWELPESSGESKRPHLSGTGVIVELDKQIADELWDLVPWDDEFNVMAQALDTIHPIEQRELRNAAHHLLWHVKELCLDREPLTTDKL